MTQIQAPCALCPCQKFVPTWMREDGEASDYCVCGHKITSHREIRARA